MALGNGERYYSPGLGRFQQEDSFGGSLDLPSSLNRHGYVNDNPLRFIDPTGQLAWDKALKAFGRGALNAVLELPRDAADLVDYTLANTGIAGDPQYLEPSGGIAKAYLSYKAQGADTDIAVLSTVRDVSFAVATFGIEPMIEGHINAYYDYAEGKTTKDQYEERLWEIAGGAAGVAATASVGSRLSGEGWLGKVTKAPAVQTLEEAHAPKTALKPLEQNSGGSARSLPSAREPLALPAGREPLALPAGKEPLQLGEGDPPPARFIADADGNVQDLATGRGNPNPIPRQDPFELGAGEGREALARGAKEGALEGPFSRGIGPERQLTEGTEGRGVFFVGDDLLPALDRPDATLGRAGGTVFLMPLEDASTVLTVGDAARASGMAPSITGAYVAGGEGFGLAFPTRGLPVRIPTAADAGGFPHFLEGGRTAVRTAGSKGGFLRNPNREFVTPGGGPVPPGSVLFKIGPNGEQIPIRRF